MLQVGCQLLHQHLIDVPEQTHQLCVDGFQRRVLPHSLLSNQLADSG